MKILHILDHSLPVQSGYAFRSHSILLAQKGAGIDAVAVTSPKHFESWNGEFFTAEEVAGVSYYRSQGVRKSEMPFLSEIRLMSQLVKVCIRLVREQHPDVLHPHSPTLNAIPAIVVGKIRRIPVVYEMRSSWEDAAADRGIYSVKSWKYRLGRWLETWICRQVAGVVVICEGLKRELIARGVSAERITVVPNGVDVELFARSNGVLEGTALAALAEKKVIGFMGSFFRWEGLDLLVDALAIITKVRTDVALLLVGSGEMLMELNEKISRLSLERFVVMLGQVKQDKIPGLYRQVDIMAFPRVSTRLTEMVTPLKPLEAMAMKKAVVASDVGGHQELIRHGATGLLFQAGNAEALAQVLVGLFDSPQRRTQLEQNAFKWVVQERSWTITTRHYGQAYSRCLCSDGEGRLR